MDQTILERLMTDEEIRDRSMTMAIRLTWCGVVAAGLVWNGGEPSCQKTQAGYRYTGLRTIASDLDLRGVIPGGWD